MDSRYRTPVLYLIRETDSTEVAEGVANYFSYEPLGKVVCTELQNSVETANYVLPYSHTCTKLGYYLPDTDWGTFLADELDTAIPGYPTAIVCDSTRVGDGIVAVYSTDGVMELEPKC